jgi:hypothetical protein
MNKYQKCIFRALTMLIRYDNDLIENQPKEECINHRLALFLERELHQRGLLEGCCVDMEYDKYRDDQKKIFNNRFIRPDIIVHERRSGNRNNLIAIEAKKRYGSKEDREKVRHLVKSEDFQYLVGAVISYLPGKQYTKIKFCRQDEKWDAYWLSKKNFDIIYKGVDKNE